MIYLDTSVALAQLLAEDRQPPPGLWARPLVASRLVEYELWVRLYARGLGASHGESARRLLERLAVVELSPAVLTRVLEPFPVPARTHDALHLATMAFVRERDPGLTLACYDERLAAGASALGIRVAAV